MTFLFFLLRQSLRRFFMASCYAKKIYIIQDNEKITQLTFSFNVLIMLSTNSYRTNGTWMQCCKGIKIEASVFSSLEVSEHSMDN